MLLVPLFQPRVWILLKHGLTIDGWRKHPVGLVVLHDMHHVLGLGLREWCVDGTSVGIALWDV